MTLIGVEGFDLTISLVEIGNLDVVTAFTTKQAEVCLIEIGCTRQLGSGNVRQGMLVEIEQHPVRERAKEYKKDGAESDKRDVRGSFGVVHVQCVFLQFLLQFLVSWPENPEVVE